MGRYIDFDVLTSKKPRKGFEDETLPRPRSRRIFRHGSNLPAVLSGLYLAWRAIMVRHYDIYVFTAPPFTLSIGAWLLQAMGRKVIIDVRDNLDAQGNRWPRINKICWWFVRRIEHRTASFMFLDPGAARVLSGYNPELEPYCLNWLFIIYDRMIYAEYNDYLSCGHIPDYRKRQKSGYAVSSFVNLLHLGFKNLPVDGLHYECVDQPVQSWETSAKQMQKILEKLCQNNKI
jgi:hypothetical protein